MYRRPSQWVFSWGDGKWKMSRIIFYEGEFGDSFIDNIEVRNLRWYEKLILWVSIHFGVK